ncbi:MAG: hypothetical protein ACMUIU_05600 [bacterium]
MDSLLNKPAFNMGSNQYYWGDVLLAAVAWGYWSNLKEDVRKGLACVKRMRCMAESPTNEEMNSAIKEFLNEHEFLSVDEAEKWLKQWDLKTIDLMKFICISILRKKWAEQLPEIISGFPVTDQEISLNLKAEAICSGRLFSVCQKMAGRLSIYEKYEKQKKESVVDQSEILRERDLKALLNTYNANLRNSDWRGFSFEVCEKKLEILACSEIYYQHFCSQAFTSDAINEQIRLHNFDWIRIDFMSVSFQDEQIAREAILCVRDDGERLGDMAERLNSRIQKGHYYLDCIDSSLHTHFLHAQKNELVGPLDLAGRPTLFLISDKVMPSEKDPCIKEKAKKSILQNLIDYETLYGLRWKPVSYKE